ncbi:MAG: ferritin family protein [Candidatus Omnitrophica bacterium]|nr:ferritin family protein [Candidatus Omnitrophota bacterium]
MVNIFDPQNILKIAIDVEGSGKKLYEVLEAKVRDKKVKAMWKYLKEQEEIHRQIFQKMLNNIGDYIVYAPSPDEYNAYLKVVASEYIFTQELIEKKTREGFSSDSQAVDFGIYIEKESILTYSALRKYVLPAKQSVLDKVIDEEKKHLVDLVVLKDQMKPIPTHRRDVG